METVAELVDKNDSQGAAPTAASFFMSNLGPVPREGLKDFMDQCDAIEDQGDIIVNSTSSYLVLRRLVSALGFGESCCFPTKDIDDVIHEFKAPLGCIHAAVRETYGDVVFLCADRDSHIEVLIHGRPLIVSDLGLNTTRIQINPDIMEYLR